MFCARVCKDGVDDEFSLFLLLAIVGLLSVVSWVSLLIGLGNFLCFVSGYGEGCFGIGKERVGRLRLRLSKREGQERERERANAMMLAKRKILIFLSISWSCL
jgi:hypothetical protein